MLFFLSFLVLGCAYFSAAANLQPFEAPKPAAHACWRHAVSRAPAVLPDKTTHECPKESPEKSMGLCYPKCDPKLSGSGPLCWDDCSQLKFSSNGVLFCCETDEICSELLTNVGKTLPSAIAKLAMDIAMNPSQIVQILKDFKEVVEKALQLNLPTCDKLTNLQEMLDSLLPKDEGEVYTEVLPASSATLRLRQIEEEIMALH